MHSTIRSLALVTLTLLVAVEAPRAQTATATRPAAVAALKVTTPEQFFGHQIGADYVLPNYTKFT